MGGWERGCAPALGVALLTGWLGVACSGSIENPMPGASGGPGSGSLGGDGLPGTGPLGTRGPGSAGAGADLPGAGGVDEAAAPTTRAYRLTHAQWQRSVRDLLQLPTSQALPGPLRDDPVQSGSAFDDNATTLVVDEALFSSYERAASELAALVTGDPALLAKVAPDASLAADARADAFIRDLGFGAHRRPLSAELAAEYRALFDLGPTLYTGLPAFEAGARAVLEAMLLSRTSCIGSRRAAPRSRG